MRTQRKHQALAQPVCCVPCHEAVSSEWALVEVTAACRYSNALKDAEMAIRLDENCAKVGGRGGGRRRG
eukprot:752629-Hanusia_phi.AAC.2